MGKHPTKQQMYINAVQSSLHAKKSDKVPHSHLQNQALSTKGYQQTDQNVTFNSKIKNKIITRILERSQLLIYLIILLAILGCIPTVAAEICTKSNGLLANEKTCECDGLTCDISTGSSYCYSAGGASSCGSKPIVGDGMLTDQVKFGSYGALNEAYSVIVSPNGLHIYAVNQGPANHATHKPSIISWDRDVTTGELTNLIQYKDEINLKGVTDLAISSDGISIYAVAGTANTIVYWDRDKSSGSLTNSRHIKDVTHLNGDASVTVSPDNNHVYAVASTSKSIVYWTRNKVTGELTDQKNLVDASNLQQVNCVTLSPDGKNVYVVAAYASHSIVHWQRDIITGALSHQVNLKDETNLKAARSVIVSPDGKNVYAVAAASKSIVSWNRDLNTGALTQQTNLIDENNLHGARSVAVTTDNKNVIAVSHSSATITQWDRNLDTGILSNQISLIDSTNLPNVRSVAVSPDDLNVYSVTASNKIIHWKRKNFLPTCPTKKNHNKLIFFNADFISSACRCEDTTCYPSSFTESRYCDTATSTCEVLSPCSELDGMAANNVPCKCGGDQECSLKDHSKHHREKKSYW